MQGLPDDARSSMARGFKIHAIVFVVVNIVLIVINLIKTPHYFWAKWVLLDWGVGLATHAWIVSRPARRQPQS